MKKKSVIALIVALALCFQILALSACSFGNNGGGGGNGGNNGGGGGNKNVAVQSITLSQKSMVITKKDVGKTLTATVYPSNATDKTIRWSSSNTKVAEVDFSGKVTFKTEGEAVITAKASNGITATCNVRCTVPYADKVAAFVKHHNDSFEITPGNRLFVVDPDLPYVIGCQETETDVVRNQYSYEMMISVNGSKLNFGELQAITIYPTIGESGTRIVDDLLSADSSNSVELMVYTGYTFANFSVNYFEYEIVDNKLHITDGKYYPYEFAEYGISQSTAANIAADALPVIERAIDAIRDMFLEEYNIDIYLA